MVPDVGARVCRELLCFSILCVCISSCAIFARFFSSCCARMLCSSLSGPMCLFEGEAREGVSENRSPSSSSSSSCCHIPNTFSKYFIGLGKSTMSLQLLRSRLRLVVPVHHRRGAARPTECIPLTTTRAACPQARLTTPKQDGAQPRSQNASHQHRRRNCSINPSRFVAIQQGEKGQQKSGKNPSNAVWARASRDFELVRVGGISQCHLARHAQLKCAV